MRCDKPFYKRGAQFGCGQCLPCRINRRRLWAHRILLEALVSSSASFVTLTYKDTPDGGSLVPRDLQLWFKRLRKEAVFRYFAVGEYGDFSERPHYHAAMFGIGPGDADLVRRTWGLGHIMVGDLTYQSASYVAGYVTKKMTAVDDVRLNGRHPEFARMSLRPGIGAGAMSQIAVALQSEHGRSEIARTGDVPLVLRHGGKMHPLGRYLRSILRQQLSVVANDTGADTFKKSVEMLALREAYAGGSFTLHMEEAEEQRRKNMVGRHKIFSQRGTL